MLIRPATFIVEDNETIRLNLGQMLEEYDCIEPVGHADNELSACRWLNEHQNRWQLVIIDLFLSEGSGFGVLRHCRMRRPHQRALVLTNYATPKIEQQCRQLGADEVFDKSRDLDALVSWCKAQTAAMLPVLKSRQVR